MMMDDGDKSMCKKNDKRAQHDTKNVRSPLQKLFVIQTYSTSGTADASATPSRRPHAQKGSMGSDSPCGRAKPYTPTPRACASRRNGGLRC